MMTSCEQQARDLLTRMSDTGYWDEPQRMTASDVCELANVFAKLAAAESDAARYRFLRDVKCRSGSLTMDGTASYHFSGGWPALRGQNLDAAVDAAIEEVEKTKDWSA